MIKGFTSTTMNSPFSFVLIRTLAWLAPAALFSSGAMAQSANPLVPAKFEVPATLETGVSLADAHRQRRRQGL